MTGALEGGGTRRYLRQFAAAVVLGLMFMDVLARRFAMHDPVRGAAVAAGTLALAAVAHLLGRCSRTPRAFFSLFLFGLCVATRLHRQLLQQVQALVQAAIDLHQRLVRPRFRDPSVIEHDDPVRIPDRR